MSGIKRYLSDNAYKAAEHSESPSESNPFVTLHKAIAMRSDWNQSNSSADNYIKNKPTIKAGQGEKSIIEGDSTTASGFASHAEGYHTEASGNYGSHAEGNETTASGFNSHAEGTLVTASGASSHAEGGATTASGNNSHAEGYHTTANHKSQHVFGEYNIADPSLNRPYNRGNYVEIVGNGVYPNRSNARTLDWDGNETLAGNLTIGGTITANGQEITPTEPQVQADWNQNDSEAVDYIKNKPTIKAGQGESSIVEGDIDNNVAEGEYAHTEGSYTTASGTASHAEGNIVTASGASSHAEGWNTTASGLGSHAEGYHTEASGGMSHAEGAGTTASGDESHAEGLQTTAKNRSQHVFGENNIVDPSLNAPDDRGNYIEIVGNGATSSARSNARTLDWDGNEVLAGNLTIGGTISANGGQILPQKQADWNQSDPEAPDFVKNRQFYEDVLGELVLSGTPVGGALYFDWGEVVPVVGKSYSIEFDIDNGGILVHQTTTGTGQAYTEYSPEGIVVSIPDTGALFYTPTNFSAEGHNVNGKFSGNPNLRFLRLLDSTIQKIDAKFIDGYMAAGTGINSNKFNSVGRNVASGDCSHAEGYATTASGDYGSHAEGLNTKASGDKSHAEGDGTIATGISSHAEGGGTTASGEGSHAEGFFSTASGNYSHAGGYQTTANHKCQHVFGEHNIADPHSNLYYERGNYIEIVGNGATNTNRSNARTLDWSGNEMLTGTLTIGGASGATLKVESGALKVSFDGGTTWLTVSAS